MIDAHLRSKTIDTADIKNLIIGGQTGIDGIRFCLAAVTNGENLADPSFSWFLQYKNKNGQGESVGLIPVYENGLVKLSWVPNSLATQVSGRMQIQLYAAIITGEGEAAVVTTKWVSEPAVIYIQENLNPSAIVATEPSVFDYYLTMYASYKEAAKAWASEDEDVEVEGGLFSSKHYSIKAAALYAFFNNRFLGAKAADPATDNDGNALVAGAVYFNTTSSTLRVFSGSDWGDIANGAVSVTYTPAEGMGSSNVQDAIDELHEKKADLITMQKMQGAGWNEENLADHEARIVSKESEAVAFENLFNSLTNPLSVKPVLNLDFANRKVLDPRITFARASTGKYYDGKTFAKAEENLLTYSGSGDFWFQEVNISKVPAATTAPDGTVTATHLIPNSGTNRHAYGSTRGGVLPIGTTFVGSVYLKAGVYGFACVQLSNATTGSENIPRYSVSINLSDGTIGGFTAVDSFSGVSATVVDVFGDQTWWRVILKGTTTKAGDGTGACLYVTPMPTNGATYPNGGAYLPSFTADGNSGIYAWGGQIEVRETVTAYTPTTDQPITNYIPVLKEAGVDEARFDHDPVTGESLGLLIEEQRTNLALYNEDFNAISWSKGNSLVVSDVAISPNGTQSADMFIPSAITGLLRLYRNVALSAGTYTWSVFVKYAGRQFIQLLFGSTLNSTAYKNFDLLNGTVTAGNVDGSIKAVGNGWYRISITAPLLASNDQIYIWAIDSALRGRGADATGDGYNGYYVWGAQFESGSFPTSYIPTAGSQVTRSADNASIIGENFSSWYRQGTGSIYAEAMTPNVAESYPRVIEINDNTVNNRIMLFPLAGMQSQIQREGVVQATFDGGLTVKNVPFKVGLAFTQNDIAFTLDAGGVNTDNNALIPRADRLFIGGRGVEYWLNGYIKKIAYYNQRLSNADLQTLTT